jgi:hypothetical protein
VGRWLALAAAPHVVQRALVLCVVVGSLLAAINHGDAILAGTMTSGRWARVALTYLVPYVVSTISSVGALLRAGRTEHPAPGRR